MGVIVALDGGGTKTDVVAVTPDGAIRARWRAAAAMPQQIGVAASVERVARWVAEAAGDEPLAAVGVYLSGLDLPRELSAYTAALEQLGWPGRLLVDNDVFALLRAGTEEPDAVAVVCGTGINAVGRRADGASVRFPALGGISGDWGGGHGLGQEALWYAARDADGRGEPTALTAAVCAEFKVASIPELIAQLHFGERDHGELSRLAPAVFGAADAGDPVAQGLVDRQADEIVTMAGTCLRRLDLLGAGVPVVLGGGIVQAQPPRLMTRIAEGLSAVSPTTRLVQLTAPPILGAAQLSLAAAGASAEALARFEAEFATQATVTASEVRETAV